MTVTDIINSTTITAVWAQLGGDQPRGGRARAFWRDGSDNRQAVSLSDEKGTWFDHRDGRGGGVLDLIATVECCTRVDALRWLAAFTGLPLDAHPLSPSERRAYSLARQEGAELAMWKDRLLVALLVDLHRWGRTIIGPCVTFAITGSTRRSATRRQRCMRSPTSGSTAFTVRSICWAAPPIVI